MVTLAALLGVFLVIGMAAREYTWRVRLLMLLAIVAAIVLLMRGG
ncbi:MAG TPA: hypothetical protein VIG30_02065 [Ktedonobacterales bacterium]|jgi:hypothetical protein